jgi:hypothetical protein
VQPEWVYEYQPPHAFMSNRWYAFPSLVGPLWETAAARGPSERGDDSSAAEPAVSGGISAAV